MSILKRLITNKLIAWKNKSRRMPLLLHGARQVGKTHIIRDFGSTHYANTAYVNLETDPIAGTWFDGNIDPKRIVMLLEAHIKARVVPEDTLIIFDEIQSCERALTSLKYFNENAPQYHIIAAGSLLGVAIKREKHSFPVGNVDSMTLHPFTFEEFLWAQGEDILAGEIKAGFESCTPLHPSLHKRASDLYKIYLIVGGMPASILEHTNTGSLVTVPGVQNRIINDYIADMAKYATESEAVKIRGAYNSIPAQLAKENRKFQYKIIQKGGSSTLFGEAIDWLETARVVNKCYNLTTPDIPLEVYKDFTSFKLYMSDTGLLVMTSRTPQEIILNLSETDNRFLGAIAENYVAQQLSAAGKSLLSWRSDSKSGGQAEMDFVLQEGTDIIPVEVKAGERVTSRSLNVFVQKYKPAYSIRVSGKNFGFENRIKSVPLYAVFCI
ncbi:MAG: ATP-binding protein [Defluviitaleaceae bacterium]|nr:ATP-binding protein [Defluviitaleaceae bacterium]